MSYRNPAVPQLTNVELVLAALADLGGAERSVHLEHIAQRAFELGPGAFRWDLEEYVTHIDKDKVRVSLTDAQKATQGKLAKAVAPKKPGQSKPTDAWRLTAEGVRWVEENKQRIDQLLRRPLPGLKKGKADRLRKRIVQSELFAEYRKSGRVTFRPFDFADLVECSPDASNEIVQAHFDELNAQAQLLREPELSAFLSVCAKSHGEMLLD